MLDLAYGLGLVAASPWLLLGRRGKGPMDWDGRFGRGVSIPKAEGRQRVLIHAVSLGEVNLIRLLVERLSRDHDVVVAATTNTGLDRAVSLFGAERVVRYPFDFTWAVARVLDRVRPDVVVTAELEVWPNLVQGCRKRGIPVAVVNGRLSDKSIRGYRRLRWLLKGTFGKLAGVGAQTRAYADRFIEMGVPAERVVVLDTMKWDTAEVAEKVEGAKELRAAMGLDRSRPVVVLGSTGVDEEVALAEAIRRACGEVQIVVVPRKPERFEEVAWALADAGWEVVQRSRVDGGRTDDRGVKRSAEAFGIEGEAHAMGTIYLLDTLGELRKAYALADVVVVGRSFNGWGGSDPIEPVALGRPVVMGPDHRNFLEVVEALVDAGGLKLADDVEAAGREVAGLLGDQAARAAMAAAGRGVILSRQGATERHALVIERLLAEGVESF